MNCNECVQVFVRCRPLLDSEKQLPVPVEVHAEVNKIIVRDTGMHKNAVKAFTFDKVFGAGAEQAIVCNSVAAPLIKEVLMGFNCTILAYGQTGTGKTFTIEGDRNGSLNTTAESWNSKAGIIPRSMKRIFEALTNQKIDFEVNVSFLELYNEEIYDLLSKSDDLIKLKLYDSSKDSVTVQGLEIRNVKSMQDVYDVLNQGCKKRRKAATFLNKMSSRSHSLFTVIVKMRERSAILEKIKIGKLNLVDLAGSENIGRSGAVEKRAREAGSINQSLLALGRVITALCENAVHIPYRESKLTRLLRDSLGGQTKTTVIATISPSVLHLDETLNTLEYALRAKNITNRPEINAQVSATALAKEYFEKILLLKGQIQELSCKREFQVDPDNLKYLENAISNKSREIQEQCQIKEKLMTESQELDKAIAKAMETLSLKDEELKNVISNQNDAAIELAQEQDKLRCEEKELLILEQVEVKLHEKLHKTLKERQDITNEVDKMEEKLREATNDNTNLRRKFSNMCRTYRNFNEALMRLRNQIVNRMQKVQKHLVSEKIECDKHLSSLESGFDTFIESSDKISKLFENVINDVEEMKISFYDNLIDALRHEENKARERQADIESKISSLVCNFDPLKLILSNYEENLQTLHVSLINWKNMLTEKLIYTENLLNNYMSTEDKNVWALRESCKDVTEKQKEFVQEYSKVISVALAEEIDRKAKWEENLKALEETLEQTQIFFTSNLENDIGNSIVIHDKIREHAAGKMCVAESITAYCESSKKSTELFREKIMITPSQTLCDKMNEMSESANKAITNCQDLYPSFANSATQTKLSDECMDSLEKRVNENKSRRKELPEITSSIQNFKENLLLKCGRTSFCEHEAELKTVETNQATALKELQDVFNQFHNTFVEGVSGNISTIEESDACGISWKEGLIKDNDGNPDIHLSAEEPSDKEGTSTLDVTFTLPGESRTERKEMDCSFCKNNDMMSVQFLTPSESLLSLPESTSLPSKQKKSLTSKTRQKKKGTSLLVEQWFQELLEDADENPSECE